MNTFNYRKYLPLAIVILGVILLMLIVVIFIRPRNEQRIDYVGRIIDNKTLSPIRSAKIALEFQGVPLVVYTDSEGVYRFLIINTTNMSGRIRVEAEGYEIYSQNISLELHESQIADIRLNSINSVNIVPSPLPINISAPTVRSESSTIPESSMIPTPIDELIVGTPTADSPTSTSPITIVSSFMAPGDGIEGLTWDGTYLWLSDHSASIFKVETSGKLRSSFVSPDATPQGLAWDGANLWLFSGNYGIIYQIHYDGQKSEKLKSFESPAEVVGGGITNDMEWDGEALWYANRFNIFRLDTSGKILSSFPFSDNVTGLAWDGSNLWLTTDDGEISIVDTTGCVLASFPSPFPTENFEVRGIAWVNGYIWAGGGDYFNKDSKVYKLDVSQAAKTVLSSLCK